jgi:hypothetical protein
MAPLHYALKQEECSIPIIEALLMEGADPNFPDADGRTAMYYGTYYDKRTRFKFTLWILGRSLIYIHIYLLLSLLYMSA